MAHRFATPRGRRTPSLKTWIASIPVINGTDTTGAAGVNSPGLKIFGTPGSEDQTILRTRGCWTANSGIGATVGQGLIVAFGVGLCTTEAAAAGAVPLPLDNPEWDGWMVYECMGLTPDLVGTDLHGSGVIDSKAMRKQPSGQTIFLSSQMFSGTGGGGLPVTFNFMIRALIKTS